ncbi:Phage-related baseplate assembly protein [Planctomycetes bacterium Pan216]|uniref:Phage-related baseplate assembly protein n=1 Tax=Kolteria novifilia TaxID=2527975 RepID=A0A518B2R1_9BACT|nr:Phage-related baseplate assembly protein [Planctomycetes bacterium Pan216]
MSSFSQAERPLRLKTSLADDALMIHRLRGREAVGDLYRFELDLVAANETEIPFDRLLGHSATITIDIPGQSKRHVNGIIAEFQRGHTGPSLTSYRAVLVPKLWLLTKDFRSRVFQRKTAVEIALKLMRDAGIDAEAHSLGSLTSQNYSVQYRESTFNFIQRILQECGLFYNWRHSKDSHRLVILDSLENTHSVDGGAWAFHPITGGARRTGVIRSWEVHQELTPGSFSVRDRAFQLRDQLVSSMAPILEKVELGTQSKTLLTESNKKVEVSEHGPEFAQWFDDVGPQGEEQSGDLNSIYSESQRVVRILMERHAADSIWVRGSSDIGAFTAGKLVEAKSTPGGEGTFLFRDVEHLATQPLPTSSGEEAFSYVNQFRAQPTTLPYRPKLTYEKPLAGPEPATVVGPREGHPHVDKHGRVRVCFSWSDDESENQSCWMRVGHAWAGNRRGHVHLPRAGDEVVVNFYQQDPDRPYVDHSMHNAKNLHPRDLPDNNSQSVFRSSGLGDSAESTSIMMDDSTSHLHMFSSNDMSQTLGRNFYHNTGGAHQSNISSFRSKYVGSEIAKEVNPSSTESSTSDSADSDSSGQTSYQKAHAKIMEEAHKRGLGHHLSGSSRSTDAGGTRGSTDSGTTSGTGAMGDGSWSDGVYEPGDDTFGEIATDSELTWGIAQSGVVGVFDSLTIGIGEFVTFNPIGLSFMFASDLSVAAETTSALTGWGALLAPQVQGTLYNTFGAFTAGTYGPQTLVSHGPMIMYNGGSGLLFNKSATSIAACIFALLFLVVSIFQRYVNYWVDHKSTLDISKSWQIVIFELLTLVIQSTWYQLETITYFISENANFAGSIIVGIANAVATLFTTTGTFVATKFAAFVAWCSTYEAMCLLWVIIGVIFIDSLIVILYEGLKGDGDA